MYEPMAHWQVRAVLAALAGAGYSIVRTSERDELRAEVERLRKRVAALEGDGDRIGFITVTYNQASGCPGLDFPDLHWGPGALESAEAERDAKRAETAAVGRGERHIVAEVIELEDGDDA